MTRHACAAIALLLALPTVAAADPADGASTFTAGAVQAVGPDPGTVSGPLVLFELRSTEDVAAQPPVPIFTVTAGNVSLELDRSEFSQWASSPVPSVANVNHFAETNLTKHEAVRIEETANRGGYFVHVYPTRDWPVPQVTLSNGCFRMEPAQADHVARELFVGSWRGSLNVSTADSLRVTRDECSGGGTDLVVQGYFMMHLWQVDVQMADSKEERLLQTGHIQAGNVDTTPLGVGRSQEAFFTVKEGVFRIPLTKEGTLHASRLEGEVDGSVKVERATGRLAANGQEESLQGNSVEVRGGPIPLAAEGQGTDPLMVRLDAGWREARTDDGRTVVVAAEAPLPAPGAAALWAALALATVAASRRRTPQR